MLTFAHLVALMIQNGPGNLKKSASMRRPKISTISPFSRAFRGFFRQFRARRGPAAGARGVAIHNVWRSEAGRRPTCGVVDKMSAEFDENVRLAMNPGAFDRFLAEPTSLAAHSMRRGAVDMSFSEIRQKDVINISDGRKLGRPIDLILNDDACAEALVVPGGAGGILGLFRQDREGCVIPWSRVRRIGDDVILVEVESERICAD